jgi:uncharacterized RDD family membrane protein YckC
MSAAIIAAADPTAVAAALSSPRVPRGVAPHATYDGAYGGFWIRVAAWLFDTIILVPLVLAALAFPPAWLVVIPLVWLYHPVMESSRWQATLGKRLCGLAVVSTGGRRISFVRALVRHFAKYLSGALIGIGFLMIALTREKRGLHDMIAGTLVIGDRTAARLDGRSFCRLGHDSSL